MKLSFSPFRGELPIIIGLSDTVSIEMRYHEMVRQLPCESRLSRAGQTHYQYFHIAPYAAVANSTALLTAFSLRLWLEPNQAEAKRVSAERPIL